MNRLPDKLTIKTYMGAPDNEHEQLKEIINNLIDYLKERENPTTPSGVSTNSL